MLIVIAYLEGQDASIDVGGVGVIALVRRGRLGQRASGGAIGDTVRIGGHACSMNGAGAHSQLNKTATPSH